MTAFVIQLKKDKVLRASRPIPLREADRIVFECDRDLESDVLRLECEGREPITLQVRDGHAEVFAPELLGVAGVQLWSVSALVRAPIVEGAEAGVHYRARGGTDCWILCAEIPIGAHSKSSVLGKVRPLMGLIPCLCLGPLALQHAKLSTGIKLTAGSIVLFALTAQLFAMLRSERIQRSIAYKTYMFISVAVVLLGLNALANRTVTVRLHTHSRALVERFGDESMLFFSELNDALPSITLNGAHIVAPHQLDRCLRVRRESAWTPQRQAIECENRWIKMSSQMRDVLGVIASPDAAEPACVDLGPQSCPPVHHASQDLTVALGPTLRLRHPPIAEMQQGVSDPTVWRPAVTGSMRFSLTDARLQATNIEAVRHMQVEVYGTIDLTEIRLRDAPASRWVVPTTNRPKTGTSVAIAFLKPDPASQDAQRSYDSLHNGLRFVLSFGDHEPMEVQCEDSASQIQVFEFYSADVSVAVNSTEDPSMNARQLIIRCDSQWRGQRHMQLTVSSAMLDAFRGAPFNWEAIQQLRFPPVTTEISFTTTGAGQVGNARLGGAVCSGSTRQKHVVIFDLQPILRWRGRRGAVDLEEVGGLTMRATTRVWPPEVAGVQYGVLCLDVDPDDAPSALSPSPLPLGIYINHARITQSFALNEYCEPAEPAVWSHLWDIFLPDGSTNDRADHLARLDWFGPHRAPPSRRSFRCSKIANYHWPTAAERRQAEIDFPCEFFGGCGNRRHH